ncbi:MAG: hypothetical protein AB7N91_23010 [Candidatus Tectimicrobiota bacterium]
MDMAAAMVGVRQQPAARRCQVSSRLPSYPVLHGQDAGHGAEPQAGCIVMALAPVLRRARRVGNEALGSFQEDAVPRAQLEE